MENTSATSKRPRLDDPVEYALIKDMYFKSNLTWQEELDPIERLERIESKERNNNYSSR